MARPRESRIPQHRAAIRVIVDELPEGHAAREAFDAGADLMKLASLIEREDLVERLNQAWLDAYFRRLQRQHAA